VLEADAQTIGVRSNDVDRSIDVAASLRSGKPPRLDATALEPAAAVTVTTNDNAYMKLFKVARLIYSAPSPSPNPDSNA
jgi:hypothetical protein